MNDETDTKLVTVSDGNDNTDLMTSMESEAGTGFEGTRADDYAIPFIGILQKNSPQCDEDQEEYVDGAKAGMFWDSGAMAILRDATGAPQTTIYVIPIHYERKFNQWKDREEGGGFVGSHAADADILKTATRDERGRLQLQDGTYLADTRQFFAMLYDAGMTSARPVIIGMASTQIKAARQWMTRMADLKINGKNGKFNPPMYGQVWELGSIGQSNSKGAWKGWRIGEPQLIPDVAIFQAAKAFRTSILSGAVQTAVPPQGAGERGSAVDQYPDSDEAPF